MIARRYLSQTPEFITFVERRRAEAMRRAPWPCRIVRRALAGHLSELRHMLDAGAIYPGPGR